MSVGGRSATTSASNGSSRRAAASSAGSSANSGSRATPATVLSSGAGHGQHPPHPQHHPHQQHLPPHHHQPPPLLETLPSAETQRHIAEARAAVVASMGNMLDTELQGRAAILHDNAAALDKQERDVVAATEALWREREKLAREADGAARKLREVGNVQNWAEVLERQFLVLEETVRLAGGSGGSDDSRSWSGSGSDCSCSDCGKTLDGDVENGRVDESEQAPDKGKGKEQDVVMGGVEEAMSDTSRSLFDGESSTTAETGIAKNSETASISTN